MSWDQEITEFLSACHEEGVRMLLVGGGAVNFHGYQRHSADLDFWIDLDSTNLNNLTKAIQSCGYEITELPEEVQSGAQNISIKFSPENPLSIELITAFKLKKSFDEVYNDCLLGEIQGQSIIRYRILNFDDLIESKIRSGRPKDLLDVKELTKERK